MSNLDAALDLQQRGFHPLVLAPLTKIPASAGQYDLPNTPSALRETWKSAQGLTRWVESLRAEDFARFRDKRSGEITYLPALVASQVDDYRAYEPNVGVYLGGSHLILIDVDDPKEFDGWMEICDTFGFDPGPPTVRSPGSCTPSGEWKHRDGGHWIYRADAELIERISDIGSLTAPRITPQGFVTPNVALTLDKRYPQLMTNRRLGVAPPSARVEGPYRGDLNDIRPLPGFLRTMLQEHTDRDRIRQRERALKRSTFQGSPTNSRLIAWENALDVTDVLEGWSVSGNDGDCDVLEHPNASSPRSAVVHVPGCPHLGLGDDSEHRLVTIWTPNVDDWVQDALNDAGNNTVSLTKLIAYRDYNGDSGRMKRDLGLWTPRTAPRTAPRGTPAQPVADTRTATRIRISSDGSTHTETISVRPSPTPRETPAPPRTATRIVVKPRVKTEPDTEPDTAPEIDAGAVERAVYRIVEQVVAERFGSA